MKEASLLKLVQSFAVSHVAYVAAFHDWKAALRQKVDALIYAGHTRQRWGFTRTVVRSDSWSLGSTPRWTMWPRRSGGRSGLGSRVPRMGGTYWKEWDIAEGCREVRADRRCRAGCSARCRCRRSRATCTQRWIQGDAWRGQRPLWPRMRRTTEHDTLTWRGTRASREPTSWRCVRRLPECYERHAACGREARDKRRSWPSRWP